MKLRQIEADRATRLREMTVTAERNSLTAETASIAAVNVYAGLLWTAGRVLAEKSELAA